MATIISAGTAGVMRQATAVAILADAGDVTGFVEFARSLGFDDLARILWQSGTLHAIALADGYGHPDWAGVLGMIDRLAEEDA